jgi:DNA-binding NarL/FixJ family response regulator
VWAIRHLAGTASAPPAEQVTTVADPSQREHTRDMPAPRTKVAMISPHDVVEAGLTAMLDRHRSRVEMVRLATSTAHGEPDVILYDVLGLTDASRAEFDRLINQTAAMVLAIGHEQRPDLLNQALARGADGCLLISICETDLLATLDAAMARKQVEGPMADPILCACPSTPRAPRLGVGVGLNVREAEILTLIAHGLSNDEIADRDCLSINTIKTYIRTAYAKIGVHTRSQAVVWVLQHGFDTRADT